MSAFTVSNKTMNIVVTTARRWAEGRIYRADPLGYAELGAAKLGQALYDMNADAVNLCYGNNCGTPVFQYTGDMRGDIGSVKALDCLIYQCSEGEVTARPMYKALVELRDYVSRRIVAATPEYDAATWDA